VDDRSWCCAQEAIFVLFKPFFGVGSSFFVWEIQKKNLTKDKKKQPKAQERELLHASFLDRFFCARERRFFSARSKQTSSDRKTRSRFTSVRFSFVGVRRFIAKTDVLYRVLFFSDHPWWCIFHLFFCGTRERNVTPTKPRVKKWHRQRRRRSRKRRR
jgi:hypothetical protein